VKSFAVLDLDAATVAPELAHVTARYAALASFGKVAALLSELLPVAGAQNAGTVRKRALRVGEDVEREILNGDRSLCGSVTMRFRVVDDHRDRWPVALMCRTFQVSVAGCYAWRSCPGSRRAAEDRVLLDDIRQVHAASQDRYGSPRLHTALRARGGRAGRGRVERPMRAHGVRGLVARPRRVRTTDSLGVKGVAAYISDLISGDSICVILPNGLIARGSSPVTKLMTAYASSYNSGRANPANRHSVCQAAGSGWTADVWSASSSAARASTEAGKPASAATFSPCDRPARPGPIR